ncbi:MAG: ATP-binding cassette domain-containing protein [Clostridia bacterium]|jgi:ABC-2 type transport system ATP-binding protein|nr:ATP-binding cassette domain-containing protein [Clostridia bacterium]
MIEVKNLSKKFIKKINGRGLKGIIFPEKKEYEAVKNINLKVKKGEIIAFVGPNGAGKSTTIKMLTGIIHPTSGEISVAGFNPTKDRKKMAYKIGCMFGQKSSLWMHLPAIDTYKLYGAMYDIPKEELEKRINEIIKTFGIEEIINIPVRKLSLGQRMICEIAGIMLHKPEILFLDEPTIGLDIVVKEKVRNAILKVNKELNTTIFLTSHDLGDIEKLCERIIIIDKGSIIKDESLENLKRDYLKERFITIIYENNIEDTNFEYPTVSKEKNKVVIKVDTSINTVSNILERFMKYGNVIDIEAIPAPLEDVIYDIYTRGE